MEALSWPYPAVHVNEVEPIFLILDRRCPSCAIIFILGIANLLGRSIRRWPSLGYAILALKDARLRRRFMEFWAWA